MNKTFVNKMKKRLTSEKERISAELGKHGTADPDSKGKDWDAKYVDVGADTSDNVFEVDQYGTNLSIEHELEKALRDIEKALVRIDNGTYGICKYCNDGISEARLEARPDASSCIACKKTFTKEA